MPHRDLARPPRQRPAAAAVTVVVHHQRLADLLGLDPGPSGAERAQADGDVEQPVQASADRRQRGADRSRRPAENTFTERAGGAAGEPGEAARGRRRRSAGGGDRSAEATPCPPA